MVIQAMERKGRLSAKDTHFYKNIQTPVNEEFNVSIELLSLLSSCAECSEK